MGKKAIIVGYLLVFLSLLSFFLQTNATAATGYEFCNGQYHNNISPDKIGEGKKYSAECCVLNDSINSGIKGQGLSRCQGTGIVTEDEYAISRNQELSGESCNDEITRNDLINPDKCALALRSSHSDTSCPRPNTSGMKDEFTCRVRVDWKKDRDWADKNIQTYCCLPDATPTPTPRNTKAPTSSPAADDDSDTDQTSISKPRITSHECYGNNTQVRWEYSGSDDENLTFDIIKNGGIIETDILHNAREHTIEHHANRVVNLSVRAKKDGETNISDGYQVDCRDSEDDPSSDSDDESDSIPQELETETLCTAGGSSRAYISWEAVDDAYGYNINLIRDYRGVDAYYYQRMNHDAKNIDNLDEDQFDPTIDYFYIEEQDRYYLRFDFANESEGESFQWEVAATGADPDSAALSDYAKEDGVIKACEPGDEESPDTSPDTSQQDNDDDTGGGSDDYDDGDFDDDDYDEEDYDYEDNDDENDSYDDDEVSIDGQDNSCDGLQDLDGDDSFLSYTRVQTGTEEEVCESSDDLEDVLESIIRQLRQ